MEPWDQLVEAARVRLASSPKSPQRPGSCKLAVQMEPNPRHWRQVARDVSLIPDGLRATIRSLVLGESLWPFFVHGSTGTGKTCAALALVDYTKDSEFWTATEFHETVCQVRMGQATYRIGKAVGKWNCDLWWKHIESRSVIVLDEIGLRDRASEAMYETVKTLLDKRINRPLMVTSNLPPEKIEAIFDARILDRLSCGTVLHVQGESMRQT